MNRWIIFLVCFAVSLVLTPIVGKLAVALGAVDKPEDRKVHTRLMPTLGGLAIFGAFYAGHVFFRYPHYQFNGIFIGSIIIVVTGILDDLYNLSPKAKLIAQTAAASIVIFYAQLYFQSIDLPFIGPIDPGYFGYLLAYFWIIGITNAINLIDGLDGLASGVGTITFLTMYVLAIFVNDYFVMTYALILAGSTAGFLVYNFHPAKIFMGDTGALFLGYIISVLSLMGFKNATFISFIVPIIILAVPLFDTFFAIVRRKMRGQSFSQADKEHLHHLLMTNNDSQRKTVLIIYAISLLFSGVAIVYSMVSPEIGVPMVIGMYVLIHNVARRMGLLEKYFLPFSKIVQKIQKLDKSEK